MKNEIKHEISFEELSKENEIEKRKTNRDNRSKTKRKNEKKNTTFKKIENTDKTKWIDEIEKKTTSYDLEIENFTKSNAEFRFFLLTKRRKNTNTDTDSETLKRLTMIVTVLTKSYFSTNDIAEFIDELNKRKRRILTQISEIFTKLSKRWKILFFERNFHFHDRKNSDSNDRNDFDFFFHKFSESIWERRKKRRRIFDFHRNFKTNSKTFSFFFIYDEKKKKIKLKKLNYLNCLQYSKK